MLFEDLQLLSKAVEFSGFVIEGQLMTSYTHDLKTSCCMCIDPEENKIRVTTKKSSARRTIYF